MPAPAKPRSIPVEERDGKKLWKSWVERLESHIDAAETPEDLKAWQQQNGPQLEALKERSEAAHKALMERFGDRSRQLLGEGEE